MIATGVHVIAKNNCLLYCQSSPKLGGAAHPQLPCWGGGRLVPTAAAPVPRPCPWIRLSPNRYNSVRFQGLTGRIRARRIGTPQDESGLRETYQGRTNEGPHNSSGLGETNQGPYRRHHSFQFGGGGGKGKTCFNLPLSKLKTHRIWFFIFGEGPKVIMKKCHAWEGP